MALTNGLDKPWAGNLEIAWFPRPVYQLAVRAAASDELSDQPRRQFGLSASWLIGKHINLAADYLYSDFKNGFVFDDNDNELNSISQFVVRIGVEF